MIDDVLEEMLYRILDVIRTIATHCSFTTVYPP
jgi:hypothetical protein